VLELVSAISCFTGIGEFVDEMSD